MNWTTDQLRIHEMKRGEKIKPPSNAVEKEADLHAQIIAYCKAQGWFYFHARMDKRSTATPGLPDFCILMDCGQTLFIEAKAKGGKRSNAQIGVQVWAQKLGHTIHLAYCMDDVLKAVEIEKGKAK